MPDKRDADSNKKSEPLPQDNNRVQESGASHLRKKTSAMTHNERAALENPPRSSKITRG